MNLETIRKSGDTEKTRPPLLFIHGAYAGAWCWDVWFLDYFAARGFDVYALSLQGHGDSPGKERLWCFGIEDYVSAVKNAVKALDRPPVLVGHSMGGYVAQKCVSGKDLTAAGLVLMAAPPPGGLMVPALRMFCRHPWMCHKLNIVNLVPKWAWSYVMTPAEIRQMIFSDSTAVETVVRFLPKIQHESVRAQLDMASSVICALNGNGCPVMVMGGDSDMIMPPEFIHETAAAYDSRAVIVPKMGHAMMLEENWEDAASLLLKWLAKTFHQKQTQEEKEK